MAEENKEKKGLVKEFKEFISKGSFIDMAVGIVVGGAFTAIVNTMVNSIITPLINTIIFLICGGNADAFGGLNITLVPTLYDATTGEVIREAYILGFSDLISAIINFFLIALVLFLLLKGINKARADVEKQAKALVAKATKKADSEEKAPEETK